MGDLGIGIDVIGRKSHVFFRSHVEIVLLQRIDEEDIAKQRLMRGHPLTARGEGEDGVGIGLVGVIDLRHAHELEGGRKRGRVKASKGVKVHRGHRGHRLVDFDQAVGLFDAIGVEVVGASEIAAAMDIGIVIVIRAGEVLLQGNLQRFGAGEGIARGVV